MLSANLVELVFGQHGDTELSGLVELATRVIPRDDVVVCLETELDA